MLPYKRVLHWSAAEKRILKRENQCRVTSQRYCAIGGTNTVRLRGLAHIGNQAKNHPLTTTYSVGHPTNSAQEPTMRITPGLSVLSTITNKKLGFYLQFNIFASNNRCKVAITFPHGLRLRSINENPRVVSCPGLTMVCFSIVHQGYP